MSRRWLRSAAWPQPSGDEVSTTAR